MDVGEALYREMTGGRSPRTEIATFGAAVAYLVGHAGSASAAARMIGVPMSSMRHWASSGRRPAAARQSMVIRAAVAVQRRARLPRKAEAKMRAPGRIDGMRLHGTVIYDGSPEREREIDLGRYLAYGTADDLLDAFKAGASVDDLAAILVSQTTDDFYRDLLDSSDETRFQFEATRITGWRSLNAEERHR